MIVTLVFIPFLIYLSVIFLYRYSGKKKLLHFDLVQFIYSFIIYPLIFIWLKNFIYILVKDELGAKISLGQLLTIDTTFSLIFMYFYAFGIIHSLTKTFALEMERDSLFDIFSQSEYFHEAFSHIGMYFGGLVVISIFGILNTFFPVDNITWKLTLYVVVATGCIAGIFMYAGLFIITDIESKKYKRVMQVTLAAVFACHVLFYYVTRPKFSPSYFLYWFTFSMFATAVISRFFMSPTRRISIFFQQHFKPGPKQIVEDIPYPYPYSED